MGGRGNWLSCRYPSFTLSVSNTLFDLVCTNKVPLPRTQKKGILRTCTSNVVTDAYVRHKWFFVWGGLYPRPLRIPQKLAKHWLTKDYSRGFMKPLHSPKEWWTHLNGIRKGEFRGKSWNNRSLFQNKFDDTIGVMWLLVLSFILVLLWILHLRTWKNIMSHWVGCHNGLRDLRKKLLNPPLFYRVQKMRLIKCNLRNHWTKWWMD